MKNKNRLAKLKRDYNKIPNKLYKIGLSMDAIALYGYFTSLSEEFNPGQNAIRKISGWGRNKVYAVIKELVTRNIIKISQEEDYGKHRLYEFVSPKDWI